MAQVLGVLVVDIATAEYIGVIIGIFIGFIYGLVRFLIFTSAERESA